MPIYEYECQQCGTQTEVTKKISEFDRLEACPKCDNPQMERLVSQTSFSLKGYGWARDNYTTPHISYPKKGGGRTTVPYKRHLDKGEKD